MAPREIEDYFHAKIPLTAAMGVHVESWDAHHLILTAPLEPNHNHLGTAFGGSIAALLILGGYGLLWLELDDTHCHIVVTESALDYRRPVPGPLRAICTRPDRGAVEAFRETFARRGKARLELYARIMQGEAVAVSFRGTFVALRSEAASNPALATGKSPALE